MNVPRDEDAERAVLGCLVLMTADPATVADTFMRLKPEAFYVAAHGLVFAALRDQYDANDSLDEIAVKNRLAARGDLAKVGGLLLGKLLEAVPGPANLSHYVGIVVAHWIRRRLINAGAMAQGLAADETVPALDAVDKAGAAISDIAASREHSMVIEVKSLVRDEFKQLERECADPSCVRAVKSGFYKLDGLTGGFRPEELIYIGGRPSMGKTSMGTDIALCGCVEQKVPTAFFTFEMGKRQIIQRLLSARARVPLERLRQPWTLGEGDWPKLAAAMGAINDAPLRVVERTMGVREIRATCRSMKARGGLGLVVIDYLQCMRGERAENRNQEIGIISSALKDMAKELDLPVVVLSQLNRNLAKRDDKRPQLSDLRDSGDIEQDGDVIIFVHRPSYYETDIAEKRRTEGEAEFILAKQRNGPAGEIIKVGWDKRFATFQNLASEQEASHAA